jgi:signal transduction histidine kinase
MNAMPPSASVLQHRFTLSELIDLNSFREVCESYSKLFQIGFKVFDQNGEMLVDTKGAASEFCSYVFQFSRAKASCIQAVGNIRALQPKNVESVQYDCFSGLRYLIAPITHEADSVGRIVYGPFRPTHGQPADLSGLGDKFNPDVAKRLLEQTPAVNQEVANNVVKHLVQVVEVMLYTGYKQVLTSRLHVETVSTSFAELQKKNRELRASFDRLKELDRLKSSFLATVSHELRTPLTSVIGYSEMLLEGLAGELSEDQSEYVKTIMDKGENLLSLISSILDFSKVESGNLHLDLSDVNLREIIDASVSTVIPLARKQGIEVKVSVAEGLPGLHVDAGKLRQSLVNILGNAVKFNRQGGRVEMTVSLVNRPRKERSDDVLPAVFASLDDRYIQFSIKDTGIGISEEKIDRVFDSFYQVDGSSTREYGGTGLGLAISHNYIQAHGGKIEVQSKAGEGSTFSLLLPLDGVQGTNR